MGRRLDSTIIRKTVYTALLCLSLPGSWFGLSVILGKQTNEDKPLSGIRLIWAWNVDPKSRADDVVAQARDIGFNAVGWGNPDVVRACKKRGMKAFALISPLSLQREGALPQLLVEGEEQLPGFELSLDDPTYPFQHGGEPVPGNREILHLNLACPRDPGVVAYGVAEAIRYQQLGYDGICWDFIGYRNYRSCECEKCKKTLADLQASGVTTPEAFYLSSLTDLYSKLYEETKNSAPQLAIATHIYPVYLPEILYGGRVCVDYCGETVAWFFQPHWSFEKIRKYVWKTLNSPSQCRSAEAMPMIGFYSDGRFSRDVKDPARLKNEINILKEQGAKHFMMCELGHLLRDAAAMRALKESL